MQKLTIVALLFFSSCTTIVNRKLPTISVSGIKSQKSIIIYSPNSKYLINKQKFESYLNSLHIFSKVSIEDEYDFLNSNEHFDLILETQAINKGFYEPYCIFTLMIIPCTPPLKFTIENKITDTTTNKTVSFNIDENANELTWLFGFLIPSFEKSEKAEEEFHRNLINHVILKIKEAGML